MSSLRKYGCPKDFEALRHQLTTRDHWATVFGVAAAAAFRQSMLSMQLGTETRNMVFSLFRVNSIEICGSNFTWCHKPGIYWRLLLLDGILSVLT